jgi:hypothetical protein
MPCSCGSTFKIWPRKKRRRRRRNLRRPKRRSRGPRRLRCLRNRPRRHLRLCARRLRLQRLHCVQQRDRRLCRLRPLPVLQLRVRRALLQLRQHILLLRGREPLQRLYLRKSPPLPPNVLRQPVHPAHLRLLPVRQDQRARHRQASDSHLVRGSRDLIHHVRARRKACARRPPQAKFDPVVRRGPVVLRPDFRNARADAPEASRLAARGRAR